jgi:hypothetical protein
MDLTELYTKSRGENLLRRKSRGGSDHYQTPEYATELILPYLNPDWTVWECAAGQGMMSQVLARRCDVVTTDIADREAPFDFLVMEPDFDFDCIVTNPPFSLKDQFLERCFWYQKPFALLMPLTALEGEGRSRLYRKFGISVIVPNRRVNFITFDGVDKGACWFPVAWFTWGLVDDSLVFQEMERV